MAEVNTNVERFIVEGDVDQLVQELQRLPGVSEDAARKMADNLVDEFDRAADGAADAMNDMAKKTKKSMAKVEDAAGDAGKKVKDLGKEAGDTSGGIGKMRGAVERISPELSAVMEKVEDLGDLVEGGSELWEQYGDSIGPAGITGTLGEVLAVAGPAAVVIAAIGTAAVVTMNQTYELREEMRQYRDVVRDTNASHRQLIASSNALRVAEDGVAALLGDLAIQTAVLNGELSDSDLVVGQLGNALADEMEPALRAAGMAFAEAKQRVSDLDDAIVSGKLNVEDQTNAYLELEEAQAAVKQTESDLIAIKGAYDEARDGISAYGKALEESNAEANNSSAAGKRIKAEVDATKDLTAETRRVLEVQRQWQEAAAQAELGRPYYELEQQLLAVEGALMDGAVTEQQAMFLRIQAEAEFSKHLEAESAKRDSIRQQAHQAELQRIQAEHDASTQQVNDGLAAVEAATHAAMQLSDVYFETRLRGMNEDSKAARKLAMQQFRVNQALNVAMAIINGAQAKMAALATLGPPVPPNIKGIVGQAVVDANLTASLVAIAATPAPKFHDGGSIQPTEMPILARQGEYVMTEAQVANAGGPAALDATRQSVGAGQKIELALQLRQRAVDRVLFESFTAGGRVSQATRSLRPTAGISPWST